MRPYVYEVFNQARELANDNDRTVGGRIYHNTMLQPFYQQAYREYFRYANRWKIQIGEGRAFFNLPANHSVLEPIAYGINNFNAPIKVQARPAQQVVTGVQFTLGTPVTVTKVSHGLTSGALIIVSDLPANSEVVDLNNAWRITVVDPDTFTLNGSRFPNSSSVVTGTYTLSDGAFSDIPVVDRVDDTGASTRLSSYSYTRGRLQFNPPNEAHQLQVFYEINGDAPLFLHHEVPIEDSLDFLAFRTISLAMLAQKDARAERMVAEAMGARWITDGVVGGQLGDLLHAQSKILQQQNKRRGPFRPRRVNAIGYFR